MSCHTSTVMTQAAKTHQLITETKHKWHRLAKNDINVFTTIIKSIVIFCISPTRSYMLTQASNKAQGNTTRQPWIGLGNFSWPTKQTKKTVQLLKKQYCNNNTDKTKGPTAVSYEVAKQLRLAAYCRTRQNREMYSRQRFTSD